MTLQEKLQQLVGIMTTTVAGAAGVDMESCETHLRNGIGHLSGAQTGARGPVDMARALNSVQRFLVEKTRLGIPAVVHCEALNGVFAPGFTSFPTPIALAATWDPGAVAEMTTIIRAQLRSIGARHALAPVLDVARDARWGRVHETFGEDPYLVSAMGVAYVKGLQGEDLSAGVLATAKHFLGYSLTEGGQNMAATHLGARELYDVYATPFEAAIKVAALGSVMNSYSEVDGVPVAASFDLLTEMLRGRMGFTGTVVSDYSSVKWLKTRQLVVETLEDAAVVSLSAGLDVELPIADAFGHLENAVRSGRLDEEIVDTAVRRVLVDKFRLGLFDSPYVDEDESTILDIASRGRDTSRKLAMKAITLVKNDGILPLTATTPRIAVIGPHADGASVNFAAYTFPSLIDMFKGLFAGEARMAGIDEMIPASTSTDETPSNFKAMLAADSDTVARSSYGAVGLWEAIRDAAPQANVRHVTGVGVLSTERQDIAAAVAAAEEADVVVLAIGGRCGWYGPTVTEGEGTDSAHIELPDHQVELARAIAETGTPMIGVLYQGRPYGLAEVEPLLNAILVVYYPGPEGPRAIASVVLGETNPSGKLPYSLPRSTGQVPIYAGQKRGSGYRRAEDENYKGYVDEGSTPLYAFGHGLSYTEFEYGPLTLSDPHSASDGGSIDVSVSVRNVGARAGDEVVQLYVSDTAKGVTRPALALAGFVRVPLAAGEQATVTFTVEMSQLGYSGVDRRFILEPGPIEVAIGRSSDDLRSHGSFVVSGDTMVLEGRRTYLSQAAITRARSMTH